MAINKVGSKGIADGSVAAIDFAPNSVTSDKLTDGTITNANLSNSSVTLAGTSIALGASGTFNNKFVDWQSVVVSDGSTVTTMVSGKGYFVNNTSAAGLVKLPISASIGDFVAIKDYAGNFGTNSLTIQRNGHNIQGVANDSLISTNRASLVLIYVDATKGWLYTDEHNVADLRKPLHTEATGGTVATSGDFKIHSFTGDGNFVVSQIGNPVGGGSNVDYLVVAGGGGGDNGNSNRGAAGGGGAGGYRTSFPSPSCNAGAFPVTVQSYPITVGAGGAGGVAVRGSDSIFSTITSTGGGHGFGGDNLTGGGYGGSPGGGPGGSGGGGDYGAPCAPNPGAAGTGNVGSFDPPEGNPGGVGDCGPGPPAGPSSTYPGGGGGGATAAGGDGAPDGSAGGSGGAGAPNTILGPDTSYAGGGGGGVSRVLDTHPAPDPKKTAGAAGAGGGGSGSTGGPEPEADVATPNVVE